LKAVGGKIEPLIAPENLGNGTMSSMQRRYQAWAANANEIVKACGEPGSHPIPNKATFEPA
jgi:hypothetical protein